MKFKFIDTDSLEYPAELLLRWEALGKPEGMPPESQISNLEKDSLHLIAVEAKKVVGCVLFHKESETSGVGSQLAISEEYRGEGFGRKLIHALEEKLIKDGVKELIFYVPKDLTDFYKNLGYRQKNGAMFKKLSIEEV